MDPGGTMPRLEVDAAASRGRPNAVSHPLQVVVGHPAAYPTPVLQVVDDSARQRLQPLGALAAGTAAAAAEWKASLTPAQQPPQQQRSKLTVGGSGGTGSRGPAAQSAAPAAAPLGHAAAAAAAGTPILTAVVTRQPVPAPAAAGPSVLMPSGGPLSAAGSPAGGGGSGGGSSRAGRYQCVHCGRSCAKPSVLEKHIRAHTGERPYPCTPCGFSFKTKSNLYKHCKSRSHLQRIGSAAASAPAGAVAGAGHSLALAADADDGSSTGGGGTVGDGGSVGGMDEEDEDDDDDDEDAVAGSGGGGGEEELLSDVSTLSCSTISCSSLQVPADKEDSSGEAGDQTFEPPAKRAAPSTIVLSSDAMCVDETSGTARAGYRDQPLLDGGRVSAAGLGIGGGGVGGAGSRGAGVDGSAGAAGSPAGMAQPPADKPPVCITIQLQRSGIRSAAAAAAACTLPSVAVLPPASASGECVAAGSAAQSTGAHHGGPRSGEWAAATPQPSLALQYQQQAKLAEAKATSAAAANTDKEALRERIQHLIDSNRVIMSTPLAEVQRFRRVSRLLSLNGLSTEEPVCGIGSNGAGADYPSSAAGTPSVKTAPFALLPAATTSDPTVKRHCDTPPAAAAACSSPKPTVCVVRQPSSAMAECCGDGGADPADGSGGGGGLVSVKVEPPEPSSSGGSPASSTWLLVKAEPPAAGDEPGCCQLQPVPPAAAAAATVMQQPGLAVAGGSASSVAGVIAAQQQQRSQPMVAVNGRSTPERHVELPQAVACGSVRLAAAAAAAKPLLAAAAHQLLPAGLKVEPGTLLQVVLPPVVSSSSSLSSSSSSSPGTSHPLLLSRAESARMLAQAAVPQAGTIHIEVSTKEQLSRSAELSERGMKRALSSDAGSGRPKLGHTFHQVDGARAAGLVSRTVRRQLSEFRDGGTVGGRVITLASPLLAQAVVHGQSVAARSQELRQSSEDSSSGKSATVGLPAAVDGQTIVVDNVQYIVPTTFGPAAVFAVKHADSPAVSLSPAALRHSTVELPVAGHNASGGGGSATNAAVPAVAAAAAAAGARLPAGAQLLPAFIVSASPLPPSVLASSAGIASGKSDRPSLYGNPPVLLCGPGGGSAPPQLQQLPTVSGDSASSSAALPPAVGSLKLVCDGGATKGTPGGEAPSGGASADVAHASLTTAMSAAASTTTTTVTATAASIVCGIGGSGSSSPAITSAGCATWREQLRGKLLQRRSMSAEHGGGGLPSPAIGSGGLSSPAIGSGGSSGYVAADHSAQQQQQQPPLLLPSSSAVAVADPEARVGAARSAAAASSSAAVVIVPTAAKITSVTSVSLPSSGELPTAGSAVRGRLLSLDGVSHVGAPSEGAPPPSLAAAVPLPSQPLGLSASIGGTLRIVALPSTLAAATAWPFVPAASPAGQPQSAPLVAVAPHCVWPAATSLPSPAVVCSTSAGLLLGPSAVSAASAFSAPPLPSSAAAELLTSGPPPCAPYSGGVRLQHDSSSSLSSSSAPALPPAQLQACTSARAGTAEPKTPPLLLQEDRGRAHDVVPVDVAGSARGCPPLPAVTLTAAIAGCPQPAVAAAAAASGAASVASSSDTLPRPSRSPPSAAALHCCAALADGARSLALPNATSNGAGLAIGLPAAQCPMAQSASALSASTLGAAPGVLFVSITPGVAAAVKRPGLPLAVDGRGYLDAATAAVPYPKKSKLDSADFQAVGADAVRPLAAAVVAAGAVLTTAMPLDDAVVPCRDVEVGAAAAAAAASAPLTAIRALVPAVVAKEKEAQAGAIRSVGNSASSMAAVDQDLYRVTLRPLVGGAAAASAAAAVTAATASVTAPAEGITRSAALCFRSDAAVCGPDGAGTARTAAAVPSASPPSSSTAVVVNWCSHQPRPCHDAAVQATKSQPCCVCLHQADAAAAAVSDPGSKQGARPGALHCWVMPRRAAGDHSRPEVVYATSRGDMRSILTHSSYWSYQSKLRLVNSDVVTTPAAAAAGVSRARSNSVESAAAAQATVAEGGGANRMEEGGAEVKAEADAERPTSVHMNKANKALVRSLSTPSNGDDGEKRVKIFVGGFKSEEEYTYVRGRGRGKYVCERCGIRCKKPSMLKKHIRTHTDLRPYSCKHCDFSFKTKGNLTKHMRSKAHHKRCLELGVVPVPTNVDDSQIDEVALAQQQEISRESRIKGEDDDDDLRILEEDDDDDDDDDEDDDDDDDDDDGEENDDLEDVAEDTGTKLPHTSAGRLSSGSAGRNVAVAMRHLRELDTAAAGDRKKELDVLSSASVQREPRTPLSGQLRRANSLPLSQRAPAKTPRSKTSITVEAAGVTQHSNNGSEVFVKSEPAAHGASRLPAHGNTYSSAGGQGRLPGAASSSVAPAIRESIDDEVARSLLDLSKTPVPSCAPLPPQLHLQRQTTHVSSLLTAQPDASAAAAATLALRPAAATGKAAPRHQQEAENESTFERFVGVALKMDKHHVAESALDPVCTTTMAAKAAQQEHDGLLARQRRPHGSPLRADGFALRPQGLTAAAGATEPLLPPRPAASRSQPRTGPLEATAAIEPLDVGLAEAGGSRSNDSSMTSDRHQGGGSGGTHAAVVADDVDGTATFWCKFCEIALTTQGDMTMHRRSRLHMDKLQERGHLLGALPTGSTAAAPVAMAARRLPAPPPAGRAPCAVAGVGRDASAGAVGSHGRDGSGVKLEPLSSAADDSGRGGHWEAAAESEPDAATMPPSPPPPPRTFGQRAAVPLAGCAEVAVAARSGSADSGAPGASPGGARIKRPKHAQQVGHAKARTHVDFVCPHPGCGKQYTNKDSLKYHIGTHVDGAGSASYDRPGAKCDVCDKKFKSISGLKQHLVTHAQLRPYVCEYCDAGFTTAQSLKFHLRTHTQERPYICTYCGDTFARSDHLKQHTKRHLKNQEKEQVDHTPSDYAVASMHKSAATNARDAAVSLALSTAPNVKMQTLQRLSNEASQCNKHNTGACTPKTEPSHRNVSPQYMKAVNVLASPDSGSIGSRPSQHSADPPDQMLNKEVPGSRTVSLMGNKDVGDVTAYDRSTAASSGKPRGDSSLPLLDTTGQKSLHIDHIKNEPRGASPESISYTNSITPDDVNTAAVIPQS